MIHDRSGGLTSMAQGGKFKHGFFAGMFASMAGSGMQASNWGLFQTTTGGTVAAAVVGGTASALGGGKFANGAVTGAYTMLFNHMVHRPEDPPGASSSGATDISQAGLEFIAGHEGYSSTIYKDVAGLETIGYGHLIKPGENFSNGITKAQGLALLKQDAQFAVNAVNKYTTVSLNQNQFDALTSFTFNIGAGALRNSTLLRMVNAGNLGAIPNSFMMWNKARVNGILTPVQGLTNRRIGESNLYINGTY